MCTCVVIYTPAKVTTMYTPIPFALHSHLHTDTELGTGERADGSSQDPGTPGSTIGEEYNVSTLVLLMNFCILMCPTTKSALSL